jgi:negative regulator of flagellin synthesis FlgM
MDVGNKINGLDSQPVTTGSGRPVARTQGPVAGAPSEQAPAGTAEVHITDTASRLAALEQAVRDLPSVDEARVTQVRSALEDGSYVVRPAHIADNLLKMEQSLGQLPPDGE